MRDQEKFRSKAVDLSKFLMQVWFTRTGSEDLPKKREDIELQRRDPAGFLHKVNVVSEVNHG